MFKNKILSSGLFYIPLTLVVICADLVSKHLVISSFELYDSIEVLPFFNITYVRNYGAAFSFLADQGGWQKYFLIIVTLVVSIAIFYTLSTTKKSQKLSNIAYCLILGGAIGNLYDRSLYGYVVDFLDFYYKSWHFPTFNIADSAICIGAFLMILESILDKK